ncbi:uncharacterized protein F5891DRAFT_975668 [Suillus fuscotomentosus]|uniref:Homing endonuclease LAGLIDADG domain-containing protein n=1 Tax=Suillus fuscotomentosus TaxID=1912939 RepID=A0AAD4HQD6_9AGAM|nr:uncharacterized protein F5891DRAFT_975668 [Suillus fuscotomentosus]KAG1906240.1 hypothetical protein F5891DRAFT_975668 [Suillus fuscotomentosus]
MSKEGFSIFLFLEQVPMCVLGQLYDRSTPNIHRDRPLTSIKVQSYSKKFYRHFRGSNKDGNLFIYTHKHVPNIIEHFPTKGANVRHKQEQINKRLQLQVVKGSAAVISRPLYQLWLITGTLSNFFDSAPELAHLKGTGTCNVGPWGLVFGYQCPQGLVPSTLCSGGNFLAIHVPKDWCLHIWLIVQG